MSWFSNRIGWLTENRMAESCTNREVQGKAFCELQIKCSSEINSNQRKKFNNDCNDHVMESILLPLDLTGPGCDRAGYKKLSRDDCDNSSVEMDIASKCSDSSNSHRVSDVASVLFNKETAQTNSSSSSSSVLDSSNAVKRSMSSAFMISSLLSTKTTSSFSTVLSQASSSKHNLDLKVTNSSSSCVPGSSSTNIARISEAKQSVPDSLNKLDNSQVHSQFGLSQKSSQEYVSEQKSDTSSNEHSLMDVGSEAYDEEDVHLNNISIKTSRMTANSDNFLTVSDSEEDTRRVENMSGISVKEILSKKTSFQKIISSSDSDCHTSNSCQGFPDERVEFNTLRIRNENLKDDYEILIKDSKHTRSGDISTGDKDANNVGIMNSRTDIVDGSTDLTSYKVPENSELLDDKQEIAINIDVSVNKNEQNKQSNPALSILDTNKHNNNIVDICGVGYSEQRQSKLDYTSFESKTDIDNWKSERNFDVEKLDNKSSFNPVCESKDFNKSHFLGVEKNSNPTMCVESHASNDEPISYVCHKTSEMSNFNKVATSVHEKSQHLRVATNSNKLSDNVDRIDHKINYSDSFLETKPDLSHIKSGGKLDVSRLLQTQEKDVRTDNVQVRKSLYEGQNFLCNQDRKGNYDVNNQIPCAEDLSKKDPVNSTVQKYSFKNILNMPKDKILIASTKNSTIRKDTEHLTSTESVHVKSSTTGSTFDGKGRDEQHAKLMETTDRKIPIGDTSLTKMEATEVVQNNESSNDRKRFQTEEASTAPKRSRLDSMGDKEEKKSKDNAPEVSEDISHTEKSVASTDTTKQNSITLSNEALQNLITLRARAFIKNQKQTNLDRLNLRTRGMQSASNLWKETAKHLERSVLELAALNQKLESRKAHFLAVKRLANKSVGIQVGEESTGSVSNAQPISSNNSTQRNSPKGIQSPVQRTGNRPGRPPLSSRSVANIPAAAPHTSSGKALDEQANSVNLIDLTDDDETSKNVVTKAPTQTQPLPVNHKLTVPPSGNGYVQPTSKMKETSSSSQDSSNQIIQPTISGTQLTPPSNPSPATADLQQIQLTTDISPAQQLSSPVLNLAPGARAATTTNTNLTTGQSTTSVNSKALPQNSSTPPAPAVPASSKVTSLTLPPSFLISNKHPAPLPSNMDTGNAPPTAKKRPPKPSLKISRVSQGIVLSWNMPPLFDVEKITSYQLYAYQESDSVVPKSNLWKKVGEVKSLPLPMACTLTQFQEGNKYHFAVRAVDQYGRWGSYSDPSSIYLGAKA